MDRLNQRKALAAAVNAARAAGELMRANLRKIKAVNFSTQHDIKLELDVRCQALIERKLSSAFPRIALLGEEGEAGGAEAEHRWVVDPIDGTVNFTYGIPHACVSIALQARNAEHGTGKRAPKPHQDYQTILGVVHDPFTDELWTAVRGQPARLNGRVIQVSRRERLSEAVVSMGFAKTRETLELTLPHFNRLSRRVRKIRVMGAAALALAYVATGRFDAYIECGISLWDIAAGGLLVECAGGKFWCEPIADQYQYRMVASNGLIHRQLPIPR
jgi:myo-inositol-1(or 4)-monophosphatase